MNPACFANFRLKIIAVSRSDSLIYFPIILLVHSVFVICARCQCAKFQLKFMFLHATEMFESDTGFNVSSEMFKFDVVSHNYL